MNTPFSDRIDGVISLQNALHQVLTLYLNGSQFRSGVSKASFVTARRLLVGVPNVRCSPSVPQLISHGYRALEQILSTDVRWETREKRVSALQRFEDWESKINEPSFLEPAVKMGNILRSHAHFFCYAGIHGSISTLDYIKGFSDLDTILMVKKAVILNPHELAILRGVMIRSVKYLFQTSLFQHHGHMVATQIDLRFYPNVFFPTPLFAYTTRCAGSDLVIMERDDEPELMQQLSVFREQFRSGRFSRIGTGTSLYDLISLNQCILLLPALWCGLVGQGVYKRFSFDPFYECFAQEHTGIVRRAEQVRTVVRADPPLARALVNATSILQRPRAYQLQHRLISRLFYRHTARRVLSILGVEAPRMVINMIDRILEDYHARR